MLKNKKEYSFLISFYLFLFLKVINIKSQTIELPLKIINSSYSKYPISKKIYIKKYSLFNINHLKHLKNSFIGGSQSTLSINIDILYSLLFAAEIELGSNNQKFNVILDTGSQILWVPEIESNNTNIWIEHFYDPKTSKTSKKLNQGFEIIYGTGYCKGYYYQDSINFLSKNKYNILFGSANNSIFEVEGAEGIMGLAKYYSYYLLSPILTLKKNGVIKSTSFSFKYDNKKDKLFFFAGDAHSDFSTKNVAFCNLLNTNNYEKMLWACKLNSFGLIKNLSNIIDNEENMIIKADISVILDTGTNLIILPYNLINNLEEKLMKYNCILGHSDQDEFSSQSYFIICFDVYNIPDVSIQFGDFILILNKYSMYFIVDLGLGIKGYLLNVHFEKDLDVAIIGQNFFTEFHTLFDSENNVLKFYSEYNGKIINIKNNDFDNDEGASFGFFFILFILILLILIYFCYRKYQKSKMIENNFEWMGQTYGNDSKFSNINTRSDYNALV